MKYDRQKRGNLFVPIMWDDQPVRQDFMGIRYRNFKNSYQYQFLCRKIESKYWALCKEYIKKFCSKYIEELLKSLLQWKISFGCLVVVFCLFVFVPLLTHFEVKLSLKRSFGRALFPIKLLLFFPFQVII